MRCPHCDEYVHLEPREEHVGSTVAKNNYRVLQENTELKKQLDAIRRWHVNAMHWLFPEKGTIEYEKMELLADILSGRANPDEI